MARATYFHLSTHLRQSRHKLNGSKVLENIYHFISLNNENKADQHGNEMHKETARVSQRPLAPRRAGIVLKLDCVRWECRVNHGNERGVFLEKD